MVTIMATEVVIRVATGLAITPVTGIHMADPPNMPAELLPTMFITTGHRESGGRGIQLMILRQETG
jgi:hypothetical protein